MAEIRDKADHKGFPIIQNKMFQLNTPAWSGRCSILTSNAHDDLLRAIPSHSALFMMACQAGNLNVTHIGGGSLVGQLFDFQLPKNPFFNKVKKIIDNELTLIQRWQDVCQNANLADATSDWSNSIFTIQQDVIKTVLPNIIKEKAFGFNVDMSRNYMTAHLSPVISESHYELNREVVDKSGLNIKKLDWEDVLYSANDGYYVLKSVFD